MMIFSLVAMTGLKKCCITSAYLQWLCHSGERPVARGPLVVYQITKKKQTKKKTQLNGCCGICCSYTVIKYPANWHLDVLYLPVDPEQYAE